MTITTMQRARCAVLERSTTEGFDAAEELIDSLPGLSSEQRAALWLEIFVAQSRRTQLHVATTAYELASQLPRG